MLRVEVGYYDFMFSNSEMQQAIDFAEMARDHISAADSKAKVTINLLPHEDAANEQEEK